MRGDIPSAALRLLTSCKVSTHERVAPKYKNDYEQRRAYHRKRYQAQKRSRKVA